MICDFHFLFVISRYELISTYFSIIFIWADISAFRSQSFCFASLYKKDFHSSRAADLVFN
ncbi:hypothetical protein HY04_09225 [Kaistella antarctica]|uniref:Uncharacterized protein n=1 Tax=Kaistella antarctica TaxID=266748 RepID=A0ABR4TXI9_9FLAO|nr:hypothetical protein HY04_09225 [Kaistella antarctica]